MYQEDRQITDSTLANWLCCDAQQLEALTLCRMPDDKSDSFQRDVERIANFVQCNVDHLYRLLRETASISAMRDANRGIGGLLLAARDRKKPDWVVKSSRKDGDSEKE